MKIDRRTYADHYGTSKGLVDVATGHRGRIRDVRAEIGVRERRAVLDRLFGIDDNWQRIVIDLNRLHRVASHVRICSHDDRDRVTDEVHAIARKHCVTRCLQIRNGGGARHQAAVFVHVGPGQHCHDA